MFVLWAVAMEWQRKRAQGWKGAVAVGMWVCAVAQRARESPAGWAAKWVVVVLWVAVGVALWGLARRGTWWW